MPGASLANPNIWWSSGCFGPSCYGMLLLSIMVSLANGQAFCTRCSEDFSGLLTRRGAGGGSAQFITSPTARNEPSQGYRIDYRSTIVNGNPSWGWNPAAELQLQVAGGLTGVVAPTGAGTYGQRLPLGQAAVGGFPPPGALCTGQVDGTVYVSERWGAVAAFSELAVDIILTDGSPVVGLAFNYRDIDTYYAVVSSPITGCTSIIKVVGGVPSVIASTTAPGSAVVNSTLPTRTTTRLHVAKSGNAITVWLNGRRASPVLTGTDSSGVPLPPGAVGIWAAAVNKAYFDNWLLVQAPSCSDGIQNGAEEGVDCGAACGNTCASELITETLWSQAGGGSLVGWFRETWGSASGPPSWAITNDNSADSGALTQRQNTGLSFQGAPGGNSDNWMGGAFLLCGKCGRSVDQEITIEVKSIDNDWTGVVTRYTDRDNFYQINTRQENPQTAIHRRRSGVNTVLLALNTKVYTVDSWYTLRMRTVGGRVTIWWDDVLWQDIEDPSPLMVAGWAGIFVTNQDNSLWRRARVVNYRPINALCLTPFAALSLVGRSALAISTDADRLRSASATGVQTTFFPSSTGAGDMWHSPFYTSFSSVPLAVTTPRGKALDFRANAGFPVFLYSYTAAADIGDAGITIFIVMAAPAPSADGVLLHKGGIRGVPGWALSLAPGPGTTSAVTFTVLGSGLNSAASISTSFSPDEMTVVGVRVTPGAGADGIMSLSGAANAVAFTTLTDTTVNGTGPSMGFSNYLYLGSSEEMSATNRARALVYEVAVFNAPLSDADFATANALLVGKYGAGPTCPDIVPAAPGALAAAVPGSRCLGARRGDTCVMQCAPGFRLTAGALNITCSAGRWSAAPAYCEATCPSLAVPNTARLDCARGVFGDSFDSNATLVRWTSAPAQPNPWYVDANGYLVAAGLQLCGEPSSSPMRLLINAPSWASTLFNRVRVSARARFGSGSFSILPRYVSPDNFYQFTADVDSGTMAFSVVSTGSTAVLCNTSAFPVAANVWYSFTVEMGNDGSITVTRGTQVVCRVITAALPWGTAGVSKASVATVQVDSFAVETVEACPNGCLEIVAGASCTLQCDPGLSAISGNVTRTCTAYTNGTVGYSGTPLTCGYFSPIVPPVSTSLPENSPAGRIAATVNASLPPGTPGSILMEIVSGNAGNAFSIEPCSGIVRVATPEMLDFEQVLPGSRNSFVLQVRAYVAGVSPAPEATTTVSIAISDANDPPRLTTTSCSVAENVQVGTTVCTLTAVDDDAMPAPIVWTLTSAFGSTDAATVFSLSSSTGLLSVRTASLDFEATQSYTLTVRVADATNPALSTQSVVTVQVVNVQEPPIITSTLTYEVDQTRVIAGAVVSAGPMTASDPDGDAVSFSLGSSGLLGWSAATNQLIFSATRTYASAPFERDGRLCVDVQEVTLTATDSGVPPLQASVTLRVYILANITSSGLPVIRGAEVRPAIVAAGSGSFGGVHTINTDGGDTLILAASGIPTQRTGDIIVINASTTMGGLRAWNSTCSFLFVPTPACASCNGVISCNTGAGWGPGWSASVFLSIGSGPFQPVPASILLAFSYAPPVITAIGVENIDGQADQELGTWGNTPVIISGFNFGGALAPIAASYGPCNATSGGCDYGYSFTRSSSSHTSIRVLTAPGVGADLRLQLTVGSLTVAPSTVSFGYAPPVIHRVYRAGNGSIWAFGGAGGAQIFVEGRNFGPPTTLSALFPRLSYGPAWAYVSGSDMPIDATSCLYPSAAQSHTLIRCLSGPGLGANLSLLVNVGGQYSALSGSNITVSYIPPRISAIAGVGSRDLDSKGGQAFTLTLVHSGPAAFSGSQRGAFYPAPVVKYGIGNYTGRDMSEDNFTAVNCVTTGTGVEPTTISCLTDEGAGGVGGLYWRVVMGGQESVPWRAPTTCKYAPPSIARFSGVGAVDAATLGGETVILHGKNFGPANLTAIDVYYETTAMYNGSIPSRLLFRPTSCVKPAPNAAKIEHEQLICTTGPGAGAPLAWSVVVADQKSSVPTTNYVAPVVSNVTSNGVAPVTAASTEGGATVRIAGRGFGPSSSEALGGRSLVQWIEYGTSEDPYRPRSFTVVSDTLITAVLAPGMGRDLTFRVSVADQLSVYSPCCSVNGTLGYANPTVISVSPATAPSAGNVVIRVSVRNVAMLDPTTEHAVMINGREIPIIDRFPSRLAVESGNLTAAMLLPANHFLAFEAPPGVGRAFITVTSFRRSVPSLRSTSNAATASLLTYATPSIAMASISVIDSSSLPLLNASFGPGFDASDARILTLTTTNAGPSSTLARLEVQLVDSLGRPDAQDSTWNAARCVPLASQWSHERIVAVCSVPRGNVRIAVPTVTVTGAPGTPVYSNSVPFTDLAPVIMGLNGTRTGNFSTLGGDVVIVSVANLASAQGSVNVTIGGNSAAIVTDASGSVVVNAAQVIDQVVNPQVAAAGTGVDAARVVIRLFVRVPPGQGSMAPIVVYRDGTPGTGAAGIIRYAPPVIAAAAILDGNSSVTVFPYSANATGTQLGVRVSTEGGVVVLRGANFGVCPVISFGPARGAACARDRLPEDSLVLSNIASDILHVTVPEGEGDGAAFGGWRITLLAGDQFAALPAGYRAPVVTRAYGEGGRLPTTGGVRLILEGANFGRFSAPEPIVTILLGAGSLVYCDDVQRETVLPHRKLSCVLPVGSGANLTVGVSLADVLGYSVGVLSYDSPEVRDVTTWAPAGSNLTDSAANLTASRLPPLNDFTGPAGGPARGGYAVRVAGSGFGVWAPGSQCVFLAMSRAVDLRCDGAAHNYGEGEVEAARVLLWTHTDVVFVVPPSAGGVRFVYIVARGQRSSGVPSNASGSATLPASRRMSDVWTFDAPVLHRIQPRAFSTEGRELITIHGRNLGFGPTGPANLARLVAANYFLPAPLPLSTTSGLPSGISLRVNFFSASRCISSAVLDEDGTRSQAVDACRSELDTEGRTDTDASGVPPGFGIMEHEDDRLVLITVAGVGVNRNLSVSLINMDGMVVNSAPLLVSYAPPVVDRILPSQLQMKQFRDSPDAGVAQSIVIAGRNFGSADTAGWSEEEKLVDVTIDDEPCTDAAGGPATRVLTPTGAVGLQCLVGAAAERAKNNTQAPTVGFHSVRVRVAGQVSWPSSPTLFQVTCQAGFYAAVGETCLACPLGASCWGYDASRRSVVENRTAPDLTSYQDCTSCYGQPIALPGFHNLAGSEAAACPGRFKVPGRDICMVPCEPAESCAGANVCGVGYVSKAPTFRCSSCAKGFYKRGGLCVSCPQGSQAILVVYAALIIVAAMGAYALQKLNVNIAVASIGIDFFQVLAVFAQTRVKWPPAIAELFHVLSAFNLNVEIVAPECFLGDVSFVSKFSGILLLPTVVMGLFAIVHLSIVAWKAGVKGRRNNLTRHSGVLVSSAMLFMYLLYIYETRTLLEVFNCAPTAPPDGKEYLQVVFEECGKPGGTQMTLLPWSIVGLAVYTVGYPAFVAWNLYRNREKIMEDQLLRAKNVGDDRLTNPNAYELRKRLSRVYYQFRPDTFWWSLIIVARKFFIAFVSVMFNRSASFQMAACLLVLICSYGLHLRALPYMGPGTFDYVLRAHKASVFTSAVHARIYASIASIESRGRKRAYKNLMDHQGKVDRSALLGVLTSWLFDYNFVEATLLFGACIVCIMGLMFESSGLSGEYYADARQSAATVVLIIIAVCILYWFTVLAVETFLLATERQREKMLLQNKRSSRSLTKDGAQSPRRTKSERGGFDVGKLDVAINPLMTRSGGVSKSLSSSSLDGVAGDHSAALDAVAAFQAQAPPLEMWRVFAASYKDQAASTAALQVELQAAKAALAATTARDTDEPENSGYGSKSRSSFGPVAMGDASSSAGGSSAEGLKGYARSPLRR